MDTLLSDIYYDTKFGFIGAEPLYEKAKLVMPNIKKSQVKKWLNEQNVNQIHRENTKRTNYLPIFSNTPSSYQIDLTFIPKFKTVNRGYEMMMTCININTRVGFIYKLKKKTETYDAIQQFIKDASPLTVTTDNGSEFIDKKVKKLFDHYSIKYIQVQAGDKHKMGKVERFNRTIKERLNRYFTMIDKPIWFDIIDDVVENYNNTVHSSIGQTPYSVTEEDEERIIQSEIIKTKAILRARNKKHTISIGDLVRVPLKKKLFEKGEPRYSVAHYVVKDISDFGNAVQVVGKNESYKFEELQLVKSSINPPLNIPGRANINVVAKENKVARQLRDLNIDQGNIRQGKREKRVVQRLDL